MHHHFRCAMYCLLFDLRMSPMYKVNRARLVCATGSEGRLEGDLDHLQMRPERLGPRSS
jgi:hypothetical protein